MVLNLLWTVSYIHTKSILLENNVALNIYVKLSEIKFRCRREFKNELWKIEWVFNEYKVSVMQDDKDKF